MTQQQVTGVQNIGTWEDKGVPLAFFKRVSRTCVYIYGLDARIFTIYSSIDIQQIQTRSLGA